MLLNVWQLPGLSPASAEQRHVALSTSETAGHYAARERNKRQKLAPTANYHLARNVQKVDC